VDVTNAGEVLVADACLIALHDFPFAHAPLTNLLSVFARRRSPFSRAAPASTNANTDVLRFISTRTRLSCWRLALRRTCALLALILVADTRSISSSRSACLRQTSSRLRAGTSRSSELPCSRERAACCLHLAHHDICHVRAPSLRSSARSAQRLFFPRKARGDCARHVHAFTAARCAREGGEGRSS
jgi:hypothetical protein